MSAKGPGRRDEAGPAETTPATAVVPAAGTVARSNTAPVVQVETVEVREPVPGTGQHTSGLTPITLLVTIFLAYLLYKIQIVVILLIVGILLATAISGPVEYLHKRRNIGRGFAILIMYVLIITGLVILFSLLLPPVIDEGSRLARALPNLVQRWREQVLASPSNLVRTIGQRFFDTLPTPGTAAPLPIPTSFALGVLQGVGGGLVTLFSIFLIAFYWLTERPAIKRAVVTVFRPTHRRRALRLWGEVEDRLGGWIRGQLILMAVVGVLATAAYGIMGIPFWLVLGVIAGLTEAIPNVGPILGAIPAVAIALTKGPQWALAVIVFVVVLQFLENAVLVPRIMKGTVGLTPLTIILAILAGSEFRGVVGALLAIPVSGAIQVILADLLAEKRKRDAAEDEQQGPGGFLGRVLDRRRRPTGAPAVPVAEAPGRGAAATVQTTEPTAPARQ